MTFAFDVIVRDFKETLVENNDFPEKAVEESTEEENDTNDDFVEKEEKK